MADVVAFPDRGGTGFRRYGRRSPAGENVVMPTEGQRQAVADRRAPQPPPFDPFNPAHQSAWRTIWEYGQYLKKEQDDG